MAWGSKFRRAIRAAQVAPIFLLENVPAHPIGITDPIYTGWKLASAPVDGVYLDMIAVDGVDVSGAEVTPVAWTSTVGAFSIGLTGPMHRLLPLLARGQMAMLRVGFAGDPPSAFETVAIGQLWNLTGHSGRWTLSFRDVLGALGSRHTSVVGYLALFAGVGNATTLTANYVSGSGTCTVGSTAGWQRQDDGSGALKGLISIGSIYRTWTAKTPTTFTVSTAATVLGIADANVASGEAVVELVYLDDHPIDATHRILTSTGTANANGLYDWLPARWGYGLPESWLDVDDMADHRSRSQPASGSATWEWWAAAEQADGMSWLQAQLAAGGFFLTMRQGALTVRCAVDPATEADKADIETIDADTILEIEEYEAFASAYGVEYASSKITSASNTKTTTATIGSFPAESSVTHSVATQVYSNESAIRDEIAARISTWDTRVPERLVLGCRMWTAGLAPGDLVYVTTPQVTGRYEAADGGYQRRRAWVAGVAPDWLGWRCRVVLYVLPETAEPFVAA